MLIPKEIIRVGEYFYIDEKSGLPRKLVVTPDLVKHWHEQGNKMLSLGLTVPVPCEHDFDAHPMTPADKLRNNSGWVKEYRVSKNGRLFGIVDVTDEGIAKKLPHTIRWTSPWFNSFTDGEGRQWNNVISHLALTTRPRIVAQEPFSSVAAALSMASLDVFDGNMDRYTGSAKPENRCAGGFCLSRAGLLNKMEDRLVPQYPVAFSLYAGGIKLADDDMPPPKKDKKPPVGDAPGEGGEGGGLDDGLGGEDFKGLDSLGPMSPLSDAGGDVGMEELLCDLLQALGVPMPDGSNEGDFKRHLYEATMSKIKELTGNAAGATPPPDQNKSPATQAAPKPGGAANPIMPQVHQEQQPMYMGIGGTSMSVIMSIDDINKIEDSTMRTVALSMFAQVEELKKRTEASEQKSAALEKAKLDEATKKRRDRITLLSRLSPKIKDELESMVGLQSMAMSLSTDGVILDPMRQTLDMLEKGLSNMPALLRMDQTAMSVVPHPTDADQLSAEGEDKLVDDLCRSMGCLPTSAN